MSVDEFLTAVSNPSILNFVPGQRSTAAVPTAAASRVSFCDYRSRGRFPNGLNLLKRWEGRRLSWCWGRRDRSGRPGLGLFWRVCLSWHLKPKLFSQRCAQLVPWRRHLPSRHGWCPGDVAIGKIFSHLVGIIALKQAEHGVRPLNWIIARQVARDHLCQGTQHPRLASYARE
jgi:hypothetical protein